MAMDERLAGRIRAALADTPGLSEKRMFGGIGWMIHGNMAAGAHHDGRMVIRCSREDFPELLTEPGASPMLRGTTPMRGWVIVDPSVVVSDDGLGVWLGRGRSYAASLPPR